jgi:cob(I)alamin adenosyltransferase
MADKQAKAFKDYKQKTSVVIVYTGEGKGKTSAGMGLLARGLGNGFRCAFIQFIKHWEVSEHKFIQAVQPLFGDRLTFYKGGLGFFNAGELSAKDVTKDQHRKAAQTTYSFALECVESGQYDLVVCDEINNAVNDGLLTKKQLQLLIKTKHTRTNLCLTGRNFPTALLDDVDIATDMSKLKHHFDEKFLANPGIDY